MSSIPNRDLYANEWQFMQDVVECRWEFGGQREFSGAAPVAPESGVRAKVSDPNQTQIVAASAAGLGYQATDKVVTVWASTLDPDFAWAPMPDDRIIVLDPDNGEPRERWIIKSVQSAMFGAQFICLCRLSPLTRNPANATPT